MARAGKKSEPVRKRARRRQPVALSSCRALIPLDTTAVRQHYMRICEHEIEECLTFEACVRHHIKNEEAYHTWLQVTLGPLYTELRAAQEVARAARTAYRQAARRAGVRTSMLDEIVDIITGQSVPPDSGDADARAADDDDDSAHTARQLRAQAIEEVAEYFDTDTACVEQLLKDSYRRICRALHPDVGGRLPEGMEWVWHEAQIAYEEADIIGLRDLETRVLVLQGAYRALERVSDVIDFTVRVSAMQQRIDERVAEMRTSPAWGFDTWDAARQKRVQRRAEQELREAIAAAKENAAYYAQMREQLERHEAQRQAREERAARADSPREEDGRRSGVPRKPRRRRSAPAPDPALQPDLFQ